MGAPWGVMGLPAAKQNDRVVGVDIHIVMIPAPPGPPIPTPLPHPFAGLLNAGLSPTVNIMGMPAAIMGCKAANTPPHVPAAPGPFQAPPTNLATVMMGSPTVMINGKPAVRSTDTAITCNDPAPLPMGKVVVASSTVMIG